MNIMVGLMVDFLCIDWKKPFHIINIVWSGIGSFLNSKIVLLVVGFALTTVVGFILNTQYNNLAWNREAALRMKLARFETERKVVFDCVEALTAYQVADGELLQSYYNLMGKLQPSREELLLDFAAKKEIMDEARRRVNLTIRFARPVVMDKYSSRAKFLFAGSGSQMVSLRSLIGENHEKLFLIGWAFGNFQKDRNYTENAAKQARMEMIPLTNRIEAVSTELVRNLFSDTLASDAKNEREQDLQKEQSWWAHWWAL